MSAETETGAPRRDALWRYLAAFAGAVAATSVVIPFLYGFIDGLTQMRTSETVPHAFVMAVFVGAFTGAVWAGAFRVAGDLEAQLAVPWLGTLALVVWVVALLSAFEHAMREGAWPSDPSRELVEITLHVAAFFAVFRTLSVRLGRW